MASSRNAVEIPKAPIVRPATAGPMILAPLNIAELRATALAMSSRPTISTENAWRVGMSNTLVTPPSAASSTTCHTSTVLLATNPNSASARAILAAWVPIRVLRLGKASAISPPNRPRNITGRNWAAATTPSMNGSPVSSSTSQLWATVCIQVPTNEVSWPAKNSR